MGKASGIPLLGGIPFLMLISFFSCVEQGYQDIEIADSTKWRPTVALPVGAGALDINDYFQQYTRPDTFSKDTFRVCFGEDRYLIDQSEIKASHRFDFSLSNYVDSSEYLQQVFLFFDVHNHYPTRSRVQIYLQGASDRVLDSVFDQARWVEAAQIDDSGRVSQPSKREFTREMNRAGIDNLFRASSIRAEGTVRMRNQQVGQICFSSAGKIAIEVHLEAKLMFEQDDWYFGSLFTSASVRDGLQAGLIPCYRN